MGSSFKMFFLTLTTLLAAFRRFATSLENVAQVAEEMSSEYVEVSRLEREVKLTELGISVANAKAKAKALTVVPAVADVAT